MEQQPTQPIDNSKEERDPIADLLKYLRNLLPKTRNEWLVFILLMMLVITIGIIFTDRYISLKYKMALLQTPCSRCNALQANKGSYEGVNWSVNWSELLGDKYVVEVPPTNIST